MWFLIHFVLTALNLLWCCITMWFITWFLHKEVLCLINIWCQTKKCEGTHCHNGTYGICAFSDVGNSIVWERHGTDHARSVAKLKSGPVTTTLEAQQQLRYKSETHTMDFVLYRCGFTRWLILMICMRFLQCAAFRTKQHELSLWLTKVSLSVGWSKHPPWDGRKHYGDVLPRENCLTPRPKGGYYLELSLSNGPKHLPGGFVTTRNRD